MAAIPGAGGNYSNKTASEARGGQNSINIGGFNVSPYSSSTEKYVKYGVMGVVALVGLFYLMPKKKKRGK